MFLVWLLISGRNRCLVSFLGMLWLLLVIFRCKVNVCRCLVMCMLCFMWVCRVMLLVLVWIVLCIRFYIVWVRWLMLLWNLGMLGL